MASVTRGGDAWHRVAEHMASTYGVSLDSLRPIGVRGYWQDADGQLYFYREPGMPRAADGTWRSPYRDWKELAEPPERKLALSDMAFGCPTCGAPFSHIVRDLVAGPDFRENGKPTRIHKASPRRAVCSNEHEFLLDPDVVLG